MIIEYFMVVAVSVWLRGCAEKSHAPHAPGTAAHHLPPTCYTAACPLAALVPGVAVFGNGHLLSVFGHLVDRCNFKRVWARDLWHLSNRLLRKVLMHTLAVLLNIDLGNPPLHLARTVTL